MAMTEQTNRDLRERAERHRLIKEAIEEDRNRAAAQLALELHRQRTAEAEKAARLRELRLAKEASEAQLNAKRKPHRAAWP
jgi:hypothetical protein